APRVPPVVADEAVEAAHGGRKRRDEDHHRAARPHERGGAAQRGHVVLDVLQHVEHDRRAVLAGLARRQAQPPDPHHRMAGEALGQRRQPTRVGLGRGVPGAPVDQLRGVVAESGTDLDRVVAQVRCDQAHQPPAVVPGAAEVLEYLRLQPGSALSHPHARRPRSHHGGLTGQEGVPVPGGHRPAAGVAAVDGAEVTAPLAAGVTSRTPETSQVSEVAQAAAAALTLVAIARAAVLAVAVTATGKAEDAPALPVPVPVAVTLLLLLAVGQRVLRVADVRCGRELLDRVLLGGVCLVHELPEDVRRQVAAVDVTAPLVLDGAAALRVADPDRGRDLRRVSDHPRVRVAGRPLHLPRTGLRRDRPAVLQAGAAPHGARHAGEDVGDRGGLLRSAALLAGDLLPRDDLPLAGLLVALLDLLHEVGLVVDTARGEGGHAAG